VPPRGDSNRVPSDELVGTTGSRRPLRRSRRTWNRWRVVRLAFLQVLGRDIPPRRLALSFLLGILCGIVPVPGFALVPAALAMTFGFSAPLVVAGVGLSTPVIVPTGHDLALLGRGSAVGAGLVRAAWTALHDVASWWLALGPIILPTAIGVVIIGPLGSAVAYSVALHAIRVVHRWRSKEHAR